MKHGGVPRIAALLLVLTLAILLGYFGFVAFVREIFMPGSFAAYGVAIVAVTAGVASFFSPCAFPLLPGYLSFASGERRSPLRNGLWAAAGIVSVNLGLGLLIGAVGAPFVSGLALISDKPPSPVAITLRLALGTLLVALGLLQFTRLVYRVPLLERFTHRLIPGQGSRPGRAMFLYGVGYNTAGLGCTAPFLAAVVVFALAAGGVTGALAAFLLFSGTMAVLMISLSYLVGTQQTGLVRTLQARTGAIKAGGAVVLVAVGGLLLLFTLDLPLARSLFFNF